MRNKRILLIGSRKSGKSTISKWINKDETIKSIQNIQYTKMVIDTPGAYLECPWTHKHLINAQIDAYCVLMIVNQKEKRYIYPPNFANSFNVPTIGVVTNSDKSIENRQTSIKQLKQIGIKEPYYFVTEDEQSFKKLHKILLNFF